MKRILWVGDATVASGFAACTHTVCDELHEHGWDVHVLGINYFGDPHPYEYNIYPCYSPMKGGRDGFGVCRIRSLVDEINPDVIVLLNDPWNIPAYMDALQAWSKDSGKEIPPVYGWLAVDGKNMPKDAVNDLDHVITWTKFASRELVRSGYSGSTSVVPLGVDAGTFQSIGRKKARSHIAIDGKPMAKDDFIVGCVGRNQFRKRLDLTIEYFAEFARKYEADNAKLLIHSAPTGDEAFDLRRIADYYGIKDKLLISEGVLGSGLDKRIMPVIYSVMDTLLTTTQGEGWGLCTLEAMSCGIPCIVPDWSGLGDWTAGAALAVSCTSSGITAPFGNAGYTIGGVPDKAETVNALGAFYASPECRERYSILGRTLAQSLPWERTAREFRVVLETSVEGV